MAIYHFSVKTVARSAGRSATAAIAYRAGEKIYCEREGREHDYSRKTGVEYKEIYLPKDAPEHLKNREKLWNEVEQRETRKNSTVAREFEIAFPSELNQEQRLAMLEELCTSIVDRHQVAVDACIHSPHTGSGSDERNYHAHILMSTRKLTPEGFTEKTRELDQKHSGEIEHWREHFADICNMHLHMAGYTESTTAATKTRRMAWKRPCTKDRKSPNYAEKGLRPKSAAAMMKSNREIRLSCNTAKIWIC